MTLTLVINSSYTAFLATSFFTTLLNLLKLKGAVLSYQYLIH